MRTYREIAEELVKHRKKDGRRIIYRAKTVCHNCGRELERQCEKNDILIIKCKCKTEVTTHQNDVSKPILNVEEQIKNLNERWGEENDGNM